MTSPSIPANGEGPPTLWSLLPGVLRGIHSRVPDPPRLCLQKTWNGVLCGAELVLLASPPHLQKGPRQQLDPVVQRIKERHLVT